MSQIKYIAITLLLCASALAARKGILELDDVSWDRIVDGSKPVLVAFQEFSWKDPTDYEKVSEEFKGSNVIVAKVDCSANEDLKKRFGIDKTPTFKFFAVNQKDSPLSYAGGEAPAELIDFVRVQLNPQLQELKNLAVEFMKSAADRTKLTKKATELIDKLTGPDQEYAKFYLASMKKISEKGNDFVASEKERLNGLISNKATGEKKKGEFTKRLNILNSFSSV